jgi:signal transduction histidine kinase
VPRIHARDRSATTVLLVGLLVTLVAVIAYSVYITRQIGGLRQLQSELNDRSRRDSLQLLRIQNDLNAIGLAMRDMLDGEQPYPLTAWSTQLQRLRADLEDALRREEQLALAGRTAEQRGYLASAFAQFWDAVDYMFATAAKGQEANAREQIRLSLQARLAALNTAVARLLVQNNESEEATARRVSTIYADVQRQVYWFLGATLVAIVVTSGYVIRSNRRMFRELGSLSEQRHELAQKLIAVRETTLRHISRELHDDFGQILTAMGAMLNTAGRQAPEHSPLRADLREIAESAQTLLDKVRTLSQTLHPAILEQAGLERTVDSYLQTIERRFGIKVSYDRPSTAVAVDATVGIHVFRVLQEALSNVARHSGATEAWVRLRHDSRTGGLVELEVEDHGKGLLASPRRGLGIVTMRERAALIGGTIEFLTPAAGGTLIRLRVPIEQRDADDA